MRAVVMGLVAGLATWRLIVRRPFPWRDPLEPPSATADVLASRHRGGDRRRSGRVVHRPASFRHPLWRRRRLSAPARASMPTPVPVPMSGDDHAASLDLLAVTITAGSTVPMAVHAVGASGDGPTAAALRRVSAAVQRGAGFVDALDELERCLGAPGRDLRVPLASAVGSGAPVGPALHRLADQHRRRRRRQLEERIRRLPVLLLLPLCGLVLPAFVVLTLVPVGLSTVSDLDLPDAGLAGTGPTGPFGTGPTVPLAPSPPPP